MLVYLYHQTMATDYTYRKTFYSIYDKKPASLNKHRTIISTYDGGSLARANYTDGMCLVCFPSL